MFRGNVNAAMDNLADDRKRLTEDEETIRRGQRELKRRDFEEDT